MAKRKGFAVKLKAPHWFTLRATAALMALEPDAPTNLDEVVEKFPPIRPLYGERTVRFRAPHVETVKNILVAAACGLKELHMGYPHHGQLSSVFLVAAERLAAIGPIDLLGDVGRARLYA